MSCWDTPRPWQTAKSCSARPKAMTYDEMNMKWTWYGRYPWDKLINLDELGFDEISGSPLLKPFRHSTNLGCTRGELLPLGVWRHKQLWFVNGSPSCMLKLLCSAMLWRFQPKGKASKLLVIVRKVQCLHDDVCDGFAETAFGTDVVKPLSFWLHCHSCAYFVSLGWEWLFAVEFASSWGTRWSWPCCQP